MAERSLVRASSGAFERLARIDWLCRVGQPYHNISGLTLVASLSNMHAYLADPAWENTTLEAANTISGFLAARHPGAFQAWNGIAKKAKAYLAESAILEKLPQLAGVDSDLVSQCVRGDVIHFVIENAFGSLLKPPFFFGTLIETYEAGHMPCGWEGVYPRGRLVVC